MTMPQPLSVAMLICSNVIGGHEFQAVTIVNDLKALVKVTVYLNDANQKPMFEPLGVDIVLLPQQLLVAGTLPKQVVTGLSWRKSLRARLREHDQVLVCAGAVEAGVAVSIALHGAKPLTLYLPFFYDRVPVWGKIGYAYNCMLARFCRLYDRIVTINRIQAKVIQAFTGVATIVIPNQVRDVAPATAMRPGRLLFIGRLDHQKRVDELLHWIDFDRNPFKEILLIGDGPQRTALESIAASMKHVRVTFAGWVAAEDQERLIDANDVLVLNSLLEGEPLVIREANQRGLRVIARNITGVRGVSLKRMRFASREQLMKLVASLETDQGKSASFFNQVPAGRRSANLQNLAGQWQSQAGR